MIHKNHKSLKNLKGQHKLDKSGCQVDRIHWTSKVRKKLWLVIILKVRLNFYLKYKNIRLLKTYMMLILTLVMFSMHVRKWHLANSLVIFFFMENMLCVLKCSLRDLLVREAHEGGLMGHFGIYKTLGVLHEHFFWAYVKCDVEKICEKCVNNL